MLPRPRVYISPDFPHVSDAFRDQWNAWALERFGTDTGVRRHDHWQKRLLATFADAHGRRFQWGVHDCSQFAARCHEAVTGSDARILFPRYQTEAEARAILEECGGMRGLLIRALGEPVQRRARKGEIVLVDMGLGLQPAVCMGLECFAPGLRRRLESRPTSHALEAWTV